MDTVIKFMIGGNSDGATDQLLKKRGSQNPVRLVKFISNSLSEEKAAADHD